MKLHCLLPILLTVLCASLFGPMPVGAADSHTFAIGTNDFLLDGQRFQIRCGEIHAARVPKEYWRHRLQMAKAMGLNTVCAYLFWNLHEPKPGEFVWSGQADDAEFCRIAQEEGLWVILRPGPYSCAEWEMGGTPWWLLKNDDIKMRTRDPKYINAVKSYLKNVGRVLGPLQITHGGPIIMAQVENEYGFFGSDAQYMDEVRKALVDVGFDVPLFACNPPDLMKNGLLTNLFQAGNFGSDVEKNFAKVREIQKTGPLICSEFYPGWFDTWGQPHHLGKPENYLPNLELMLKMDASFSIYMAHGGTTFGLWAGCDRPFKPDISSYDYDAPISEAGWATPKFFQTRELFAKYLLPGEKLPEPPAKNPVISIAPFELTEVAPVFGNLPRAVKDKTPRNMEAYDQGYGCILYRTELPAGPACRVEAAAINDFGYVFLDGKRIAVTDRRNAVYQFDVPARAKPAQLDILVEPMGRVNFGTEMADRKGIHGPVKFATTDGQSVALAGWKIFNLPLDSKMLGGLKFGNRQSAIGNQPAFWRGTFNLEKAGDTFLDLRSWGKGVLWVNGHCLGRFWNIGPSQTAYAPGCWLRAGKNEIIILDHLGPERAVVAGLETPILDELRPDKDFNRNQTKPVMQVDAPSPAHSGALAPGSAMQEVVFKSPVKGRYFEIESLSAQDGQPYAAIAELGLLDADGKPLGAQHWKIASVDSEEKEKEDGSAGNAIDGQTANYWHTQWGSASPGHPHVLVIDLGQTETVGGFRYTPRPGGDGVGGRIKDYRIFIGDKLKPWTQQKPQASLRIAEPKSMAAGQVYLVRVETQPNVGRAWTYAEPDSFQVSVTGAGRLVTDPALKPMNPFTVEIPAGASGEVKISVQSTNGASLEQTFTLAPPSPPSEFVAEINPALVTHNFGGLGGGVLFYDNQFDITESNELYDWCFADVKSSFLHLLIRPDCEPERDSGDWRKVELAKFDFTSAERPLRIAREALKRNPALQIYVSVYSPPAWMKSNGSTRGDAPLKDGLEYRRELAKYVFAWLKHAQGEGVPVHYLGFFNEPDWPHTQEGMHIKDLGALAEMFSDCAAALDELLTADGTFQVRPKHVFPDTLGAGSITRSGAGTEKLLARKNQLAQVEVWGVHDYWDSHDDYWEKRFSELRAFPAVGEKPIWMTEWAQRQRHGDLDSALEFGRNMLNALRLGAQAWMVFEWAHPYGNQSGLISTDWGEQTGERRYWRSKAYHFFRQIANTTPAGAEVVAMKKISGDAPLEYLALRDNGKLIVHLVNSGSATVNCQLRANVDANANVEVLETTPAANLRQVSPAPTLDEKGGMVLPVPPYSLVTVTRFNHAQTLSDVTRANGNTLEPKSISGKN